MLLFTRIALFTIAAYLLASQCTAADWIIEIVPSETTEKASIIDADFNDPYFYVVLTNNTERDLSVWREWCSWGYFCLSFDIKNEDGTSFALRRMNGAWSWNYPDATVVRPGKSFVMQASIAKNSRGQFEGFPKNFKDGEVMLQASFSVEESEDTKKKGVWTGTVSSAPQKFLIKKSAYE